MFRPSLRKEWIITGIAFAKGDSTDISCLMKGFEPAAVPVRQSCLNPGVDGCVSGKGKRDVLVYSRK